MTSLVWEVALKNALLWQHHGDGDTSPEQISYSNRARNDQSEPSWVTGRGKECRNRRYRDDSSREPSPSSQRHPCAKRRFVGGTGPVWTSDGHWERIEECEHSWFIGSEFSRELTSLSRGAWATIEQWEPNMASGRSEKFRKRKDRDEFSREFSRRSNGDRARNEQRQHSWVTRRGTEIRKRQGRYNSSRERSPSSRGHACAKRQHEAGTRPVRTSDGVWERDEQGENKWRRNENRS